MHAGLAGHRARRQQVRGSWLVQETAHTRPAPVPAYAILPPASTSSHQHPPALAPSPPCPRRALGYLTVDSGALQLLRASGAPSLREACRLLGEAAANRELLRCAADWLRLLVRGRQSVERSVRPRGLRCQDSS